MGITKNYGLRGGLSRWQFSTRLLLFNGVFGLVFSFCGLGLLLYSHSLTRTHLYTDEGLASLSFQLHRSYKDGVITMEEAMIPLMDLLQKRTKYIRGGPRRMALVFIVLAGSSFVTTMHAIAFGRNRGRGEIGVLENGVSNMTQESEPDAADGAEGEKTRD